MPKPDIFLSYNREDGAVAKLYADAFAREGFEVWWDQTLRSGETYDEVTEAALRGAKAVVVLWSPRSVASHWVRAEATIAHRAKTLVPATIETCDKPVMFELTQTAELSHWRGAVDDTAWLAFLGDVQRKIGDGGPAVASKSDLPSPATSAGGVPFVAVLPITVRGNEGDLELLAEDLTDAITDELARNGFFNVVAAGTMAAFRGQPIDPQALGQRLNLRYLVESKFQRSGSDGRLTLRLADPATGGMLRSMRNTCGLADLEAAPELFAAPVACELVEQITLIEAHRSMTKHGTLSAWDHVMRSMASMERLDIASTILACEEARLAVSAAPDLGLAHAMLARIIRPAHLSSAMQEIGEAERREILAHISRAMQLDGNNPVVLHFVTAAYTNLNDQESSLRIAGRAVELAPNSPLAHFTLGQAMVAAGRAADAIAAFETQLALVPQDINRAHALMQLGICQCVEGRPHEAESALDRSLALHPDNPMALTWKALVAAQLGKEQVAKTAALRLRENEPEMGFEWFLMGVSVMFPDNSEGRVEILRGLLDLPPG